MAGFIYFIPNKNSITSDELRKGVLSYAFDKKDGITQASGNGPDGKNGVLFGRASAVSAGLIRYDATKQLWVNCNGYYVGMWHDHKPTPADLARKQQIPGEWLELGDESEWCIPVARRWSDAEAGMRSEIMLPRTIEIVEGNKILCSGVVPRYRHLWNIANAFFSVVHDGDYPDQYVSTEEERQLINDGSKQVICAVHALQANYYLGPVEALNMLGLFTTGTAMEIFEILTDWNSYLTLAKKKTAEPIEGQHS